jgi:hypothetical protein
MGGTGRGSVWTVMPDRTVPGGIAADTLAVLAGGRKAERDRLGWPS